MTARDDSGASIRSALTLAIAGQSRHLGRFHRGCSKSSQAGVCASVTDTLAFGEWSESRICDRPCHELGTVAGCGTTWSQGSERVRSAEVIAALCRRLTLGWVFRSSTGFTAR